MKREKSMVWRLSLVIDEEKIGGAAAEGVCTAVLAGWVNRHFALAATNPSFLVRSSA